MLGVVTGLILPIDHGVLGDEIVIGDGLEEVGVVKSSRFEVVVQILGKGYIRCSSVRMKDWRWYIDPRRGGDTIAPFMCGGVRIVHAGAVIRASGLFLDVNNGRADISNTDSVSCQITLYQVLLV